MSHPERLGLAAVGVVVILLGWPGSAMASIIVKVPEPTTLTLLAAGVAAVTVGARWFRRK